MANGITGGLTSARARRLIWVWRGAAAALAVTAGALWAVETRVVSPNVTLPKPEAPGTPSGPDNPVRSAAIDPPDAEALSDAAYRLEWAANRPKKVEPAPGPLEPTPAAPGSLAGWRYLGSIITGARRSAILNVDGKQVVLAQGAERNGIRLVEVKADAIVVNDGAGLRELRKEQKTGPAVAWVTPPAGGPGAPIRPMNGAMNGLEGYTPEEQTAMRERGMDPETARAMRDRLDRLRNRPRATPAGADPTETTSGTTTTRGSRTKAAPPPKDAASDDTAGPDAPESRR